jgi:hypothetical protein
VTRYRFTLDIEISTDEVRAFAIERQLDTDEIRPAVAAEAQTVLTGHGMWHGYWTRAAIH